MTVQTGEGQEPQGQQNTPDGQDAGGQNAEEQNAPGKPNITDLPDWAQAQIRDLRKEAAGYRTKAKQFDDAQEAAKTEHEKALEAARREGASEVSKTFALRLAGMELKAALSGLVEDPAVIVEDLNLSKYVTDDGEVDTEAVAALKERYEGLVGARRRRSAASVGVGRTGSTAGARTRDELLADAFGAVS